MALPFDAMQETGLNMLHDTERSADAKHGCETFSEHRNAPAPPFRWTAASCDKVRARVEAARPSARALPLSPSCGNSFCGAVLSVQHQHQVSQPKGPQRQGLNVVFSTMCAHS